MVARNVIVFLIFFLLLPGPILAREKTITIVYTNSLNGNFDYCHCKSDPKGGLVKRATEIKKIRQEFKQALVFETGDFFTYESDPLLSKYLIRAYRHIGYDAILFGDQEFSDGLPEFLKYRKRLPFICNNFLVKEGGWKQYFTRYKIIKKGKLKIGVIGTISRLSFRYHPHDFIKKRKIKILDQVDEISKDVRILKKKGVKIIILLSHSGFERDRILQKKLPDIDVIVGGHSQTLVKNPAREGNSIIVQAGANGAHIGVLRIVFENGTIQSYKNSFRVPDEHQPEDDTVIRKLINEYKSEVKEKTKKMRFK